MKAVVLAGGKGARLRPYTTVIPKPLMPVGGYPILEIILRQLHYYGVDEVILAVGYLAQLFQAFFQDGGRYGIKISYSFEEQPLGTAGPIGLLIDQLEEDFLILNGDLLTTLNYRHLVEFHRQKGAAATIGLYRREVKIDFGVIEPDADGRLERYIEKPTYNFMVSMGVNVLNPQKVRPFITPGQHLDLPDLMMNLRAAGQPVYTYSDPCYWLDIGRVDDYQMANEIFEERHTEFMPGEVT
jgi:NDP-mannose synthase